MKRLSIYSPYIILLAVVCFSIFLEYGLNIKTEKYLFPVFIIIIVFQCINSINKQAKEIIGLKEQLDRQHGKLVEINKTLIKPSYRIDIHIEPNWQEITNKLTENDMTVNIDDIKNDSELNVEENKSLYNKSFRYAYFYNGISELEQIWSEFKHAFVEEMIVEGHIFYSFHNSMFLTKYKNNRIAKNLLLNRYEIGPNYIGIKDDGFVLEEDKLSVIPFWEIIRFFIEVEKYCSSPMRKIKKFPNKLAKKFEDNGIRYNFVDELSILGINNDDELLDLNPGWDRKGEVEIINKIVNAHRFEAQYYSVTFKMEIFGTNVNLED